MASTKKPRLVAPLRLEPRLVEDAVRLVLERGAPGVAPAALARQRFTHRRRLDEIYEQTPGETRETAFREHYRSLFDKLRLRRRLDECLQPFPTLRSELQEVLVRVATASAKEGVELWEHRSERGRGVPAYLVVSLTPARFIAGADMNGFLHSRLERAADVLAQRDGGDEGRRKSALADASPISEVEEGAPGRRCPLCAFPTMVWASGESLAGAQATIRRDFPEWQADDGCCEHCADRYVGLAAPGG